MNKTILGWMWATLPAGSVALFAKRVASLLLCSIGCGFLLIALSGFDDQPWLEKKASSMRLSGDAASAFLQRTGDGQSLMGAVHLARFGLQREEHAPFNEESGAGYIGTSHNQDLKAWFGTEGVTVWPSLVHAERPWRLTFDIKAYGRGKNLIAAPPVVSRQVKGTRIEYERAASSLAPSVIVQPILTEWYENRAEGIEQGFTFSKPPWHGTDPSEQEPLRLVLSLTGDLQSRVKEAGRSIELVDGKGRRALTYDSLIAKDATGKQLLARMEASQDGQEISLIVDDREATYPVVVDPLLSQTQIKITALDGAAGDQFGARVAISDDLVVIGANRDDVDGKADQGSAYVFVRSGSGWKQQGKLTASDGLSGDQFGAAVALSGNTIVVGARYADLFGYLGPGHVYDNEGKAYVFTRTNASSPWVEQKLTGSQPPDAGNRLSAWFGWSVAIDGNTMVIGAPGQNPLGEGAAYVFVYDGTRWTEQQILSGQGYFYGEFGYSVSIDNGTIVVGSPRSFVLDGNGKDIVAGAAYVYVGSGPSWTLQAKLAAPDAADQDDFGYAVALSGDRVIVGAPLDDLDANRVDQGSVHIFARSGTAWTQEFAISGSDSGAGDNFGTDVAIRGSTAVVGALLHAVNSNANQGAAYVFSRNAGLWSQVDELFANDGAAGDRFGVAVALTNRTAIVGALGNSGLPGAAYISELLDLDGDGLPDEWEKHGITVDDKGIVTIGNTGNGVFVDLPAMGANPNHKDIFVHADWMGPDSARPGVVFKPVPRAIRIVIDAFANAPVTNPDGFRGINLHVDLGPNSVLNYVTGATTTWGALSRAAEVPFETTILGVMPDGRFDWTEIDSIKGAHFTPAKRDLVFHYCLFANNFNAAQNGGLSRGIGAADFFLTLGDWEGVPGGTLLEQAGIFMHELGHNLGLRHGGEDDVNRKPNYISLMNYSFTSSGVFQPLGTQRSFDFSRATLASLDEQHLDEFVGISDPAMHLTLWNRRTRSDVPAGANVCLENPRSYYKLFFPTDALDWSCDGAKSVVPIVADINGDGDCVEINNADGIATNPAGDDVAIAGVITAGPNRKCDTQAVGDDLQLQGVGFIQPDILNGFNDWPALRFDGGGKVGATLGPPPAVMLTPNREPSLRQMRDVVPDDVRQEEFLSPSDVVVVSPQSGGSSSSFTFDGSGSTAITGTIVSYSWNFGDGTTGTGATTAHTYSAAGLYFVTLTVTDSNGHVNLVPLLARVTVVAAPPTPSPSPTASPGPTPVQGRYAFVKAIDSTQAFNGRQFTFRQTPPQMNDSKTLAFTSQVVDTSPSHTLVDLGYYRMSVGGAPVTIGSATGGLYSASQFGGFPFINADGLVSITGYQNLDSSTKAGIFVGTGGALTKIAGNTSADPFLDFSNAATWITSDGTVAFRAGLKSGGRGIFTGKGGPITTIADPGRFDYLGNPAMNESGTVLFSGQTTDQVKGIFVRTTGVTSTVVDDTGPFSSFGAQPSINVRGEVAFQAYRRDGTQGIFLAKGGTISTIADTTGPYNDFGPSPSINDKGTVVFFASLKGDLQSGIFTGPDPVLNKVIVAGDTLFGGKVTDIAYLRGLNNKNDIAFVYSLDTKVDNIPVEGLAIASPRTVLANISTRMRVEGGDNVLIGGFIVTGTQPKKLMVRGIGPSIPVGGKLADPTIELHDSSGALIDSNDNWVDAANRQEMIDSKIPPSSDKESAILRSLAPGAYTAILRGANETTGVGLVEVYDLDLTVDSKLANISTRGLVQTNDNVMIGGFILSGSAPQKVIVRAIGPSLAVDGKLADPTLELYDANGSIGSNDNWRSDQEAEIVATTVPPKDNAEAAIVRTLAPGAYTAIVRGANGTTGISVVEVYALN